MDHKSCNISDIENYYPTFDLKTTGVVSKSITLLLSEFLNYITKQIKNVKNSNYNLFIIQRGFETIIHCYKFLLLYTKNIDLALYHTKKAYIYYVEFIGQIGYNNHSFLKLNSTDATLFVYKKTIFEINNEYRKNYIESENENSHYSYISKNMDLYLILYKILVKKTTLELDKRIKQYNIISKECNKIILNIYNNDFGVTKNLENIKIIKYFIEFLGNKFEVERQFYLNSINLFIKKIKKNPLNKIDLQKKLSSLKIAQYISNMSHIKLVNFIFTD